MRAPYPFRRHQGEALDALAAARATGRSRAWVVLPPGAGKTLVGLETIRRERRPAVVLSPNTAIQGQWVRGWEQMCEPGQDPHPVPVGSDRALQHPVTALTYQSLAVFDDLPREPGEDEPPGELHRLHPHGRALVEAMRDAGPLTLVLDECHHLLETWGRLLAAVLEQLPDAVVLGLTATPPTSLSADQAALVHELFGDVVHETSIPAVVKEGHLAPFVDLVWLTEPSPTEQDWVDGQRERFAELTTALVDPTFGSTPFLTWVDQRFAGQVPFHRVAEAEPDLADAALRLLHAGLWRHPDGEPLSREGVDLVGEQHRRAPSSEDWALLVGDWYAGCVRDSVDDRDVDVAEGLRRALPSVGWQLTRTGLRRGRSPVDRVLARSESKADALTAIVGAEHRVLGDRLRMLVICDHEQATATVGADLRDVVPPSAGSARRALAALLADPHTASLGPVMVTGRTVAGAPATLERLCARVEEHDLSVGEPDRDGISQVVGVWTSRDWVRAVTTFLTEGGCRVLVGTRALLGEGWDAPAATGLVDLSTTTTPGSIVQTRGRTLRLDPRDPAKVAVNWTVCTVAADHPRGDNDWQRTVRKHQGYFGVDETGDVVDGVAHVHPSFSPFAPPDPATFDATNAAMLVRAEQRDRVREAWAVGEPYVDQVRASVWVRPNAARVAVLVPDGGPSAGSPAPPAAVLDADGLRLDAGATWPALGVAPATLATVLGLAGAQVAALGAWPLLLPLAVGLAVLGRLPGRLRTRRGLIAAATGAPDVVAVACAVADGLHRAGLTSTGADAVRWRLDSEGRVRCTLEATGPSAGPDCDLFAASLAECVGPVGSPRYLVPRYVAVPATAVVAGGPERVRPTEETVWHPVPTALGVRAELAGHFAASWRRWVGGGEPQYTGSPAGAGVLAAVRGTSPLAGTAVLRQSWR
ncbi:MAG: DEAD/DEAH box helicase [Nocardioides sp.]|nr:DEAD/DEAH box helicase [Nocardioides sp.]